MDVKNYMIFVLLMLMAFYVSVGSSSSEEKAARLEYQFPAIDDNQNFSFLVNHYQELPANRKVELWRHHVLNFMKKELLTNEQLVFCKSVLRHINLITFENPSSLGSFEDSLVQQSLVLFGGIKSVFLLADLHNDFGEFLDYYGIGISDFVHVPDTSKKPIKDTLIAKTKTSTFEKKEECSCNVDDDWCLGLKSCQKSFDDCKATKRGCGLFLLRSCNGQCR